MRVFLRRLKAPGCSRSGSHVAATFAYTITLNVKRLRENDRECAESQTHGTRSARVTRSCRLRERWSSWS